jgi:hypothetical protein
VPIGTISRLEGGSARPPEDWDIFLHACLSGSHNFWGVSACRLCFWSISLSSALPLVIHPSGFCYFGRLFWIQDINWSTLLLVRLRAYPEIAGIRVSRYFQTLRTSIERSGEVQSGYPTKICPDIIAVGTIRYILVACVGSEFIYSQRHFNSLH